MANKNFIIKKVFLIGDGINSEYKVKHDFDTRDILTIVRENTGDFARVEVAMDYSDKNILSLDMGDIIPVNSYSVTVIS